MQFAGTNLPHLQPTLSEIERNCATPNIQNKIQTTLHHFFYFSEIQQKSVVHVDQW
jgi:hypothetical protein